MAEHRLALSLVQAPGHPARPRTQRATVTAIPQACPVCGAMVEPKRLGDKMGWTCLAGGYAHYYQSRYAHLEQWFTSGEGNLREPLIQSKTHAA